ncbi:MAG: hypothetical protein COW88_01800 [Candidatus Lloydbacteria bacterium CG22_combo_CG10-13_8_21_14_all_47_15]|uniref:DUF4956 domain-containing protein n=1 Tax=Candidatus Lloydbacteria bacterium CG22_combo_CG10-13_8_21_14_all_47_15 TaxID=1974635 RepID=A0A2H0CUW3_9BACT|nr:MAG: hypothetical protein COW88_01800 [Candidatus Lloydbacteria bacterium CG22_combo_CG10-13_8_21_14_all_47_15]
MNNFYNLTQTELSSAIVVFNLLFAFALLLVIVFVYKRTHQGLSYSPSFIFTLIIVGILGSVVMMVVQNNLVGAFALLGAFSLIRFRTILKETRDIAFVFFALVIGVAVGTSHYSIALISTVIISLIILGLYRYHIGSMTSNVGFILTFNAKKNINMDEVRKVISGFAESFEFLQAKTYGVDTNTYIFSIKLKDTFDSAKLINELHDKDLISSVNIISGEKSVEY